VAYDATRRTAVLLVEGVEAREYELTVLDRIQSAEGLPLAEAYSSRFTVTTDLSQLLEIRFTRVRSVQSTGMVSFDAVITNRSGRLLRLPLILELSSAQHFEGEPQGTLGRSADGAWLIDLSESLPPGGLLDPDQSTSGHTVTVRTPNRQRIDLTVGASGALAGNFAPAFVSDPVTTAAVGQVYSYVPQGVDVEAGHCRTCSCAAPRA